MFDVDITVVRPSLHKTSIEAFTSDIILTNCSTYTFLVLYLLLSDILQALVCTIMCVGCCIQNILCCKLKRIARGVIAAGP